MSDDSFNDFRQADGRFAKGNPRGPATAAVTNAVPSGDVTPRERAAVARVIEAHGKLIEIVDHEPRLRELEDEVARQRRERR